MRAIFETVFDALYLTGVITLGILMLRNAGGRRQSLQSKKNRWCICRPYTMPARGAVAGC